MRITVEQFEEWLSRKNVQARPCPQCGSDDVAIHADATGNCSHGVPQAGAGVFHECSLVCLNCGFVRIFSAKLIVGDDLP